MELQRFDLQRMENVKINERIKNILKVQTIFYEWKLQYFHLLIFTTDLNDHIEHLLSFPFGFYVKIGFNEFLIFSFSRKKYLTRKGADDKQLWYILFKDDSKSVSKINVQFGWGI